MVPVIVDQEMRCEAGEAASNAIELVVEIGTLLNQSDILGTRQRASATACGCWRIHRLCNDLLPVLQPRPELMEKQHS